MPLRRLRRAAAAKQRGRGFAAHDEICNLIGLLFVGISRDANATEELDPAALLDDVCRLVRCGMEIGRSAERDMVARGVRTGADRVASDRRVSADMRLHTRQVVLAPEEALDGFTVRERPARARDAVRRCGVDAIRGAIPACRARLALHSVGVSERLFDE